VRIFHALLVVGLIAVWLAVAIGSLTRFSCLKTWADDHVTARYSFQRGCEINEGHGWKSEWLYRSDDPGMPALRKHLHSYSFDNIRGGSR